MGTTTDSALRLAIPLPPHAELETFCRRWRVSEIALFGSVLRHDFRADSDVDVLLTAAADSQHGLLDRERMRVELSRLFARPVDLINRSSLEVSRDERRKRGIMESAQVVHVAGR